MRVISGSLKSRIFGSPKGFRTHPMGEKVRAAIFNVLGDISGLEVLDAYSGSGSLAIESVSRGATKVVAVDSDKKAYQAIMDNVELLELEDTLHVVKANVATWAKNVDDTFDSVFADPPYMDLNPDHIDTLAAKVNVGGIMVISHPGLYRPKFNKKRWQLESQKTYAGANITIYKRLK